VRAHQKETLHDWAGCVVEQACVDRYEGLCTQFANVPDLATVDSLSERGLIARYKAPLRHPTNAEQNEEWVIDWPQHNRGGIPRETVKESFAKHNKSVLPCGVQRKISNTLAYLDFSLARSQLRAVNDQS
jgi:hypothetical protein